MALANKHMNGPLKKPLKRGFIRLEELAILPQHHVKPL
jgi:hypothetical protein